MSSNPIFFASSPLFTDGRVRELRQVAQTMAERSGQYSFSQRNFQILTEFAEASGPGMKNTVKLHVSTKNEHLYLEYKPQGFFFLIQQIFNVLKVWWYGNHTPQELQRVVQRTVDGAFLTKVCPKIKVLAELCSLHYCGHRKATAGYEERVTKALATARSDSLIAYLQVMNAVHQSRLLERDFTPEFQNQYGVLLLSEIEAEQPTEIGSIVHLINSFVLTPSGNFRPYWIQTFVQPQH